VTTPGGVPNLPQGALTPATLASSLQDMSEAAMKSRADARFPATFNTSTGGNPSGGGLFGVMTTIWAGVNSLIAQSDPADITGPDDLPPLFVEFIENLPLVGELLGLLDAINGNFTGTDPTLLAVQNIFAPIRKLVQLFSGTGAGYPTPAEIAAGWADLNDAITDAVTDAYQQVMDFLTGLTGSTPAQQNTWLADLLTAASDLDAAKLVNLLGMPPIPDASVPGLQAIQDAASQAWSGLTSLTGTDVSDAQQFMTTIYNEILSHARQLQSLQSTATGSRYAGKTIDVDFGDYPDGPMPVEFVVTYFGAVGATSTVVIEDGKAAWNLVNNGNRGADVMHTVPTDTDYQIVRGSMASPPTQTGSGGTPRIWSWVRADSTTTPANGVWARAYSPSFLTYRGDIGCRIGGVDTVWASNIPLTWSLDIKVVAGVGANPKQFEIYSGDTLVKRFPNLAVPAEVTAANLSQMGAGFRYWGSRTEMKTDLFGAIGPGTIKGTSVTDNLPPTLLGPTAEMYRTSTTAVSYPNGWSPLPANFWQVVARASVNIDADPVTGTFTFLDEGNYSINTCIRIGSNLTAVMKLGLWVNGSLLKATPMGSGSIAIGDALSATWSDYFLAGDVIEIATYHNGIAGNYIQAESTGTETWVTVTGVNRSYL
jgi:hypothetical protein